METAIKTLIAGAASPAALSGINIRCVSIAATYSDKYDPVLRITWTFPANASLDSEPLPGVTQSMYARPADVTIIIKRDGMAPSDIEDDVLLAAWQLGAWDVRRLEKAPMADPSEMMDPRYGISSDFGINPYKVNDHPLVIGQAADNAAILDAATDGYIIWSFVPLHLASKTAKSKWGDKDKTLKPDLTRDGEPDIGRGAWVRPRDTLTAHDHVYRLGRANHGNRSKSNDKRRG